MMIPLMLLWSAWFSAGQGGSTGSPQPKVLIAAAADLRYGMDSLVRHMADWALYLQEGRIAQQGRPSELFARIYDIY